MLEINEIHLGDCLIRMKEIPDNTIDSIVTDPPYGLKFMGKDWDHGVPGIHFWQEALRVCKPGAHMLAFGGTRTHHRLMVAIEDAGWEIRDALMWVYGSGFPKSLDVSKAIDKAAGAEREVIGKRTDRAATPKNDMRGGNLCGCGMERPKIDLSDITAPATDAAKEWGGWGTALKPAWEPIILARKPLDGTVAQNVQKWGTGGLNIDGCRVEMGAGDAETSKGNWKPQGYDLKSSIYEYGSKTIATEQNQKGRFPANLIHDGGDEVLALFPQTKGQLAKVGPGLKPSINCYCDFGARNLCEPRGDSGSAARFFYCAKSSKSERNFGCESLPLKTAGECTDRQEDTAGLNSPRAGAGRTSGSNNHHPTVKPLALMQYLCKLITQPNGTVLDPFCGSGSTCIAALNEGFDFIGIEKEQEYINIAYSRIVAACMK